MVTQTDSSCRNVRMRWDQSYGDGGQTHGNGMGMGIIFQYILWVKDEDGDECDGTVGDGVKSLSPYCSLVGPC